MKKLFIHVGPGKSGTSAVQSFLANNVELLKKKGISYPEIDSISGSKNGGVTGGNSATLARSFLNSSHPFAIKNDDERANIQSRFIDVLKAADTSIILSSELFSMLDSENVKELATIIQKYNFDVACIFYLRRHDEIVESDYAQQVKRHGYSKPIDKPFYERIVSAYDFRRIINSFEGNFGKNSSVVRVYEKEQFTNGNLLDDFVDSIGLRECSSDFLYEKGVINPSPSASMLEIMRVLNGIDGGVSINEKLLKVVFDNKYFQKQRGENYISFDEKVNILSMCDKMYSDIADRYFNREYLFINELKPYDLSTVSSEDIVSAFVKLI